ncbi:MAG: peptidoglycan-binding domain-containing protein [Myxococcota bacterium]|nr:peptidoglycan-binding domain-containing protein [Myxococcota bacterium]
MSNVTTAVSNPARQSRLSSFRMPSPNLKEAQAGDYIRSGQSGQSVSFIQQQLRAQGYDVQVDGKFGPETKQAIKQFQRAHNCRVDGIVGPETLGAMFPHRFSTTSSTTRSPAQRQQQQQVTGQSPRPSAPTTDELRNSPPGTTRAGDIARDVRTQGNSASVPVNGVNTPTVNGDADSRLARIQEQSLRSAQGELANGVREHGGRNRGDRVDEYARTARMGKGGEWCGYFTSFNYTQAARENGLEFSGQARMHSFQKSRSYFLYRNYTDNSTATNNRNDALRNEHNAAGSARRFMTFQGSDGDRYASRRNLPHEVYTNPADLPIRPGDTALWARGHVGMVESYNRETGILTTVEGNIGNRVGRRTYDLSDPNVRAQFSGFGRPAAGDFTPAD